MNLREAAELAIEALQEARSVFNGEGDTIGGCGWCHAPSCGPCEPHCEKDRAVKALRAALADTQDWNEIEALRASLREHMAEIHRLRAAGRQALDAMNYTRWAVADQTPNEDVAAHDAAMNTLRAELAEGVPETTFGNMAQAVDSKEADHIRDAAKMIEPVAYVTGFSKGYAVVQPVDRSLLMPVGMALYRSPPTINEMETVEPVAYSYPDARGRTVLVSTNTAPYEDAKPLYTAPPKRKPLTEEQIEFRFGKKPTRYMMFLIRSTERAHGIGGDK